MDANKSRLAGAAPETTAKLSGAILALLADFRRPPRRTWIGADEMLFARSQSHTSKKCRVCGCFHNVVIDRCCCESL
jgi:hypothetical protein